jgi:hypothetical protein
MTTPSPKPRIVAGIARLDTKRRKPTRVQQLKQKRAAKAWKTQQQKETTDG